MPVCIHGIYEYVKKRGIERPGISSQFVIGLTRDFFAIWKEIVGVGLLRRAGMRRVDGTLWASVRSLQGCGRLLLPGSGVSLSATIMGTIKREEPTWPI